ncbi:hypothetical protein ABTX35_08670 [Streptomyces sp. NPDC096080]|uniref:hypothetical protein n=1 Tax=Streptomyces sp. NPDC096080 TaxID=3156693 RepID=UPI0033184A01
MGFAIGFAVLLIAGAVVARRRGRRTGRTRDEAHPRCLSGRPGLSGLDAEAEANRWLIRLGASLVPPDARTWSTAAGETAGRELTRASECHREARFRLAGAHTAAEYAEVTRTAREGLAHVHAAREALGVRPEDGDVPRGASGGAGDRDGDLPRGASDGDRAADSAPAGRGGPALEESPVPGGVGPPALGFRV